MGEATVPAEHPAEGQATWVPTPDVDAGRPGHHQVAPGQGSGPSVGVIWRVRDRDTFRNLRHARRSRQGLITVAWLDDGSSTPPRLAFAVNRRVGPAVTRNRLRRRLRELARASGGLAPGVWFVTAAPGAGEASMASLRSWWTTAVGDLLAGQAR